MTEHKNFLKEALRLAEKGKGLVSPNPAVGAIIAKGNKVLGRGWHKAYGLPHAEIMALKEAGAKAKGATLYVTLEPCCHYGKTPPCTLSIIKAGIKDVFCSMQDPNPLVDGKGIEELEKNGIKVRTGLFREDAENLNSPYITCITKKRPYIILKWAQTLDGKTATYNGDSKWITSEKTRYMVKKLRFETDGILVGVNTVLHDNPSLDYEFPAFRAGKELSIRKKYHKIVLDPFARTPSEGRLWENKDSRILLIVSDEINNKRLSSFGRIENAEIIKLPTADGRFSVKELAEKLYEREIGILLVEGGSKTLSSFWDEKMADEIMIFTGNKILGGQNSLMSIAGKNKERLSEAVMIRSIEIKNFGEDFLIKGKPCFRE